MPTKLFLQFKKLLKYKSLIWQLGIKEFAVQYRYPLLGILWAFLMPLCLIATLIAVFSKIIKVIIPGYPFPLYLITGVLPWNYFASSLSSAVTKISGSGSLVKDVYFPREVIPLSNILSNLITFLISIGIMGIVFSVLNIKFSRFVIFLPMIIFLETVLIIGASLFVSSIQVRFRDIRYIVEIFLLIIFYLSPIFYPIDLVKSMPNVFFKLYLLNPFVSIVTLYRVIFLRDYLSVLSRDNPYMLLYIVIYPVLCSVIVFVIGFFVFKKLELNFVDHL